MSFTQMINRRGPNVEPWGIPEVILFVSEGMLFTIVYCSLLVKGNESSSQFRWFTMAKIEL